jgi:hypothetical protein
LGWGPIVAPLEMLREVGGYDERFVQWGAEDDAFAAALSTLAGPPIQLDRTVLLLWHPAAPLGREQYARNVALLARYQAAADDPAAMRELIAERSGR